MDRIALVAPDQVQVGTAYYELDQLTVLFARDGRPLTVKVTLAGDGGLRRSVHMEGPDALDCLQFAGLAPRRLLQWIATNRVTGTVVTV